MRKLLTVVVGWAGVGMAGCGMCDHCGGSRSESPPIGPPPAVATTSGTGPAVQQAGGTTAQVPAGVVPSVGPPAGAYGGAR